MESYQGSADFIAVCSAAKNRTAASRIIRQLQSEKLRVWVADKGFNAQRREDLERLSQCRTALILVSKQWLADENCVNQLRAASALERQTVLLFLDETDLNGVETVQSALNRSMRMISYQQDSDEWVKELKTLDCVTDCLLQDGEQPEMKKVSLRSFFRR